LRSRAGQGHRLYSSGSVEQPKLVLAFFLYSGTDRDRRGFIRYQPNAVHVSTETTRIGSRVSLSAFTVTFALSNGAEN
jgi:hypothetical protein